MWSTKDTEVLFRTDSSYTKLWRSRLHSHHLLRDVLSSFIDFCASDYLPESKSVPRETKSEHSRGFHLIGGGSGGGILPRNSSKAITNERNSSKVPTIERNSSKALALALEKNEAKTPTIERNSSKSLAIAIEKTATKTPIMERRKSLAVAEMTPPASKRPRRLTITKGKAEVLIEDERSTESEERDEKEEKKNKEVELVGKHLDLLLDYLICYIDRFPRSLFEHSNDLNHILLFKFADACERRFFHGKFFFDGSFHTYTRTCTVALTNTTSHSFLTHSFF